MESLEQIQARLAWDYSKKPADPQLRRQIATELRSHRAYVFQEAAAADRTALLADMRQFHKEQRERLQPLIEAELVLREHGRKLLDSYWLFLRACGIQERAQ